MRSTQTNLPDNIRLTTEEAAKKFLAKYVDRDEADILWGKACSQIFEQHKEIFSMEDLEKIYQYFSSRDGLVGVIGSELQSKLNTYKVLSGK